MSTNGVQNLRNFKGIVRSDAFAFAQRRQDGLKVINKSGSDIAVNKLVYISGYDSTTKFLEVALANAGTAGKATDVYVTRQVIHNNAKGQVWKSFQSTATLNTSGGSVGAAVYLDTSDGGFTATAPSTGTAAVVPVGFIHVSSSTVGVLVWDVQPATKLGANQIQTGVDATILTASGSISAANIVGTAAGQLGHANGVILVPAGGATVFNQFVYALVEMDFATAAYTAGGTTTVNIGGGGAATSDGTANTVLIQAAADVSVMLLPLAATGLVYTLNNPLNLVTTVAPTNPGTAAGVLKWKIGYRALTTQLD